MKRTPRTILLYVALLAVVTLACGGVARRPPAGGGLAYDPFYEGRNQWEVEATPESGTAVAPGVPDTAAAPTPAPALAPVAPVTSTMAAEPAVTATLPPAGPSYIDLVVQSLSLIEDQRPAFFGSLANLRINNWEGVVLGLEMGAALPVLVINLAPMTDGSQDGPDVRLDVTPELAPQFNPGERVHFSGTVRSARGEPGTDLLLEIGDTTVEKVP